MGPETEMIYQINSPSLHFKLGLFSEESACQEKSTFYWARSFKIVLYSLKPNEKKRNNNPIKIKEGYFIVQELL